MSRSENPVDTLRGFLQVLKSFQILIDPSRINPTTLIVSELFSPPIPQNFGLPLDKLLGTVLTRIVRPRPKPSTLVRSLNPLFHRFPHLHHLNSYTKIAAVQ